MSKDNSRKGGQQPIGQSAVSSKQALSRFLALEQRVLLDAAAVETAEKVLATASADAVVNAQDGHALAAAFLGDVVVSPLSAAGGSREILFVDAGVSDFESLIRNIGPSVEVHVLQGSDWASQIQSVLGRREGDVDAIHLVSHGGAGHLSLGGESVSITSLDKNERAWAAMRQALSPEGDLLIYGCDVAAGESGQQFIEALAEKTGADVAASSDLTGVASLGGDWDLERSIGDVSNRSLFAGGAGNDFLGLLADGWVQDTEISAGTSAVAITRTTDNKDWKFVGTSGSNKVDIYQRNATTGVWALNATVTGDGSGGFGFDIAAAGNKLVVGAPTYNNAGGSDGRVYVYTWNGTNWTTAPQTIAQFNARYSGRTGFNGGSTDVNDYRATADQFGYSVDIAHDGAGNYRLIMGNPYEDWWQYDNDDKDGAWGGSSVTRYERDDVGVAFVLSATAHGNFGVDTTGWTNIIQIENQTPTGGEDAYRFGGVVAVGYDQDNANWWYAVGGDGRPAGTELRTYDAPGVGIVNYATYTNQFSWDSAGNNDISMDDDYMVVANSGGIQTYKLDAGSTSWSALGGLFGAGGAVVMVNDLDQTANGDNTNSAFLLYSGTISGNPYTYVAEMQPDGTWGSGQLINTVQEVAVALWRNGPAGAYEQQQLIIPDISPDTTFTISIPGFPDTADITYSATGATMAANIQAAINAVVGAGAVTVTCSVDGAVDTFLVVFNANTNQPQIKASNNLITASTLQNGYNWSLDALTANGTRAASYHFNWDPNAADDVLGVTNEDTSVVITGASILANDSDYNITQYGIFGDVLSVTAVGTSSVGATITLGSGNITYNPTTSSYLQSLAVGQSTTDTFSVTVSDGQGGSTNQLLTVTINGANDAPFTTALVPLSPYAYQQSGSTNAYDFSAYFTDTDSADINGLIPSATALPGGWSAVADGTLLRVTIPAGTAAGDYSVTVRVTDPYSAVSGTRTFVIRVDSANNAPFVAAPLSDQVALAGYQYGFTVPSTAFADPDPAPFDNVTYTATLSGGGALPAWLSFDSVSRTFSGTPAAGDVGAISVRVTANDNAAASRGGPATVFDDFLLTIVNPSEKTLAPVLDGPINNANFGFASAISEDGNWLAVGAPGDSSSPGAAWIYQWNGSGWTYITGLAPTAPAGNGAQFGYSLDWSNDGDKLIVGARSENGGRGAVYCYDRSGSSFATFYKLTANANNPDDHFGSSVAINEAGTVILVGASHFDYGSFTDSGAAFFAAFPGANGSLTANVIPKDPADFDLFGSSVSFDENILAVASARDDNSQGMVSRIEFDGTGSYAPAQFGSVGGTLSTDAQFFYDGQRGNVLYMAGTNGVLTMDSAIDLGQTWTISSWYKDLLTDAAYNTLTRGSFGSGDNHQIIVNAGTDDLGAWNNTALGVPGFNPANVYEQQLLVIDSATVTTFTLTIPGLGTTAAITHNVTGTTVAASVQAALNTLLATQGLGTATVTVVTEAARSDVLRITFNNSAINFDVMASSRAGVSASREAQLLAFTGNTNFTLSVPGVGTTASITYSDTGATQATNIQNALNTLMGAGAVTVTTNVDGASGADTYVVQFNNAYGYNNLSATGRAMTATRIAAANSNYALTAAQKTGWHMVTAVADGTGVNARTFYYIDGVKVGVSNFLATDDIIAVGNYQSGTQRFADYIDDFRVYNRALSQSEIRNIYSGEDAPDSNYGDTGSIYVFSTDQGLKQVAKLYAPDGKSGDMLGWALDLDIYTIGGTARQGGIIVASSVFNDGAATDGGAVYIWRSVSQQSGAENNGGLGNGTWRLESKLTSFDTTASDYYGSDVAVDYDEGTGGTRLLVGAQFEDTNGLYSGAAYAYKHVAGSWLPEKFYSNAPQGGSVGTSEFFGSSVAVADTRAIIGARWRDTGGQLNDGAVYWANLLTQGNYSTVLSAETTSAESFFLPADEMDVVALDTTGTQGSISFATDGRMVYTPGAAFKTLGAGQTATDSFTYLTEQGGITYSTTVTVTVHGMDRLAEAGNDVFSVSSTAPTRLDVLANDTNPNTVNTLSIQSLATDGVQGRLYNNGSTLVYDPRGKFDYLVAGESVSETFHYTLTSSNGQTSSGMVTLVITGTDDPVIAVDDAVAVKSNAVAVVDVRANDVDRDGADTFTVVSIDDSAARGSAMINADGTISYVPGSAFDYLRAGETATDTLVYTVRDKTGNVSTAMLTVTVVGVDDAPVAFADGVSVAANATANVNVLANDVDPEGGTLRVLRLVTTGTHGTAALNPDGTISYTATSDASLDRFSYEVIDSLGNTSIATVYVNYPGGVPSNIAVDDVAVVRGMSPTTIALTGNDVGVTAVTGVSGVGNGGSLSLDANGSVVYTPGAALTRLPLGSVYVDTFFYSVQYADGSVGSATLRVYVNGQFTVPVLDDEEERFALVESSFINGEALALPSVEMPALANTGAQADKVAQLALDGMVEMAEAEHAAAAEPAAADQAASAAADATVPVGKLGLSATLTREVLDRRADMDALLRHFQNVA